MKFKLTDKVKVTSLNKNDEANPDFLGRCGYITGYAYGCGNTKNDPLYIINFNGEREQYWAEELSLDDESKRSRT